MQTIVICALYKFTSLDNYTSLREPLLDFMTDRGIKGTLLLAKEGVNGTVSGSREAVDQLLMHLKSDTRLTDLDYKESYTDANPFYRTKVRLKREIVTMGVEDIDPLKVVGTYVKPSDWNQLISAPDTVLIDTRNEYEVGIGTFKNAINPHTQSFREFPEYVEQNLNPEIHRKVAMFCTGGIRCEKSTAYLKEQGFDEVYHLQGGILKYLEDVPKEESLWEGECFVFDNRVAIDHSMEHGRYDQCHACRIPITEEDKKHPLYIKGVSCPHCHDQTSASRKAGFKERQKQIELARERNEEHIGAEAAELQSARRTQKQRQREASKTDRCRSSKKI